MDNYHLNEFVIYGKRYSTPNRVGMSSGCGTHTSEQLLNYFNFRKNERFSYAYGFYRRMDI